jgi:Domain of unknown function (DUF4397)
MRLLQRAHRLAVASAAASAAALSAAALSAGLLGAAPAAASPTTAAAASPGSGWVRLAHLSPNTPPVDVYLYSFGDPHARLVLHHVAYGMVSPYEQVPKGDYTVSMRPAGAAPASKPVLSTAFWVTTGDSYTVAGMGPASGLRLQVLDDTLTVPSRQAMVRVIQASLRQHVVRMTLGRRVLVRRLPFGRATRYEAVPAGTRIVRAAGNIERAARRISLRADTVHTLVVLDGAGHLRITDLVDAAGSQVRPAGGAATGLGGTAPRPPSSPLPWLAVTAAGALLAAASAWRYRHLGAGRRFGAARARTS